MRLVLTLEHQTPQVLPINYQYLLSSWIYKTLENANEAYAEKLHREGYGFGGKKYKLFCFGELRPRLYDLDRYAKTFILSKSPTKLALSFYVEEALQHFVFGLFKDQRFVLSSGQFSVSFQVSNVEVLATPKFEPAMRFQLLSPLCISQNIAGEKYAQFLSPEADNYAKLLLLNLVRKQNAIAKELAGQSQDSLELSFPYAFRLLSPIKSKLYTIKGIKIRGYLFDFELKAPADLLALGYFAGFGERNSSLGMGMVSIL